MPGRARTFAFLFVIAVVMTAAAMGQAGAANSVASSPGVRTPLWMAGAQAKLEAELAGKYGEAQQARARRGLKQMAEFWRPEDGDQPAFEEFVRVNFAGDEATLNTVFQRWEKNLEQVDGHMQEINRELREQMDLDRGPILSVDEVFAGYDPSAHVLDDFFQNKLAFTVLLNLPITTLQQRLSQGESWTRLQWAEARLADRFSRRIPAQAQQAVSAAEAEAEQYIAEYNIWMFHVLDQKGERLFPKGMRLLSHWNLRDQIKADYVVYQQGGEAGEKALEQQRIIEQVMERIVNQTIPRLVIDNPQFDWNPFTNDVRSATEKDSDYSPKSALAPIQGRLNGPEPDTRYAELLKCFQAEMQEDPYSPTAPTHIARQFQENRQIPEARFRAMLEQVLTSPLVPRVAALIEKRLGRKLEPFDVWYSGFRPRGRYTEAELDEMVRKRYPTAEAYQEDIPNLLVKLGFRPDRAEYVAANIVVDPARGSGHAMGAAMRGAKAHLRTRVEKDGMNYKGFNIAVHEMGHNVEQTFSMNEVDHWLLNGVPNTAFTEALAFVFQNRDLELLGLEAPGEQEKALRHLDDFWGTYEIAGVGLVDMEVWHWMYDHPTAHPAELKAATLKIARDVWNRYYAPVFGERDVDLLAVYSHMIDSFLYLPDYSLGHMIASQIEEHLDQAGNSLGDEFERMAKYGNVAPDLWMKNATGAPVGPEALLRQAGKAIPVVSAGAGL